MLMKIPVLFIAYSIITLVYSRFCTETKIAMFYKFQRAEDEYYV